MKHLILFAWLLTIPITIFPNGNLLDHQNYEGLWINKHYNLKIQIKQHRPDVIKIREGRHGRWKAFEKCGPREFVNKRSVIRFSNNRNLVLKEGHRQKKLKFKKVRAYAGNYGQSQWDSNYYDSGYNNGGSYDYGSNSYSQWTISEVKRRIKGTWISQSPYAKLKIKTQNGNRIEVKDNDGRKYYYYQDNYKPNEFYNVQGSKYVLISRNELIWTSKNGRKEVRLFRD